MNTPDNSDLIRTNTGHLLLPQSPEAFTHDADGNLTADGRWTYTWNGENRLIALETASGAVTAGQAAQRLEFAYDHQGRRIQKKVYAWNPSTLSYQLSTDLRFLYDGWNLIGIFDALNSQPPTLNRSFTWGLDLSGSLQGAGGVGGLLLTRNAERGTQNFVAYDGNGNVMALVDAGTGLTTAQYEYGPFGELLRATGPMAQANPFRFSTKYQDEETDLLYYGYRFFDAALGRWVNRDSLLEEGGENLYACARNDLGNRYDLFGFKDYSSTWYPIRQTPWATGADYPVLLQAQVVLSVDGAPPNQGIRISLKANRPNTPDSKNTWWRQPDNRPNPTTDGWRWPNLAGVFNARGALRYGGPDPRQGNRDNDFGAVVVQRQAVFNLLNTPLVSGDWDSGSPDIAAVAQDIHIAGEFSIPMTGPFCPEPPPVKLWFVFCDTARSGARRWPREWDGTVLVYVEIEWKQTLGMGLEPIFKHSNSPPPGSPMQNYWEQWKNSGAVPNYVDLGFP